MHVALGKGSPRHCLPAYLPKTRAAQVRARAAKSKNSYTKNRVKVSRTPLYSQTNSAPAAGLHLHLSPPHAAAHYTYTRPQQKSYTLNSPTGLTYRSHVASVPVVRGRFFRPGRYFYWRSHLYFPCLLDLNQISDGPDFFPNVPFRRFAVTWS